MHTTVPTKPPGLDLEFALARVGGDVDLLREIAGLFIEDYPRVVNQLDEAIARGDAQTLERTAHGLKGSVATFGAHDAMEAARTLESLGRAHKFEEVRQVLTTLELALAALRPELERL